VKKILGGDLASAQYVYFGDFAVALKEFGIDATRDDLSEPPNRHVWLSDCWDRTFRQISSAC
jgi:hypothetical protein